jgi:putative ABC transport system permease protein
MILKYVLKSFRRRKVRTLMMVLSLIVSTGLIVAMSATTETMRQSSVNLITTAAGRWDLTVRRAETSPEPFVAVAETSRRVLAADDLVTAVFPRFMSEQELRVASTQATGHLVAIDPAEDIGQVEVISGTYELGDMRAALLESTEELGNPRVGDTIEVAYSFAQPREKGSVGAVGSSQRRAVGRFTISSIVRQTGVAPDQVRSGVIVHIDDAQAFLGLLDQAEMLVALVEPALYEAGNAETAALSVRDVAVNVQSVLDDEHVVRATKADVLDETAVVFMLLQALISVYGLMSLSVVGLLVYTLVMTNVQEQRREMAILRILGSQRRLLFGIVVFEVLVIGLVGVGIGILLGQGITAFGVVPLIQHLMRREGVTATLQPAVSLSAILPAIVSALLVLMISAIKPARDASRTKVIHAINPGVADNIQLEDLEALRERRPSIRLFIIGLAILFAVVIFNVQVWAEMFGNPELEEMSFLVSWLMLAIGLAATFFIFTRPLERLVLHFARLVAPRLTYFAKRNVGRSTERNTLISLLVLLSGVLPSSLATDFAISDAHIETDMRLSMGAPVSLRSFSRYAEPELARLSSLRPSLLAEEIGAVPGIQDVVGLTYEYETRVYDAVEMRSGTLNLMGVTGDLSSVLYEELTVFTAGGPQALGAILVDPSAVVISEGMAEGLAVPLGGTVSVQGEGLDHREELTVAGIARRLPGFDGVGRTRSKALDGGTVLISLEGFHRVTTDPREALPDADDPAIRRVLATVSADADTSAVETALHDAFDDDYAIWIRIADEELARARASRASGQIFLLVLTLLSFITAVFGVFAVIYVTIYARRREIGMMKAVGARNRELNGMLSVESIAMTSSAALTGILAGTTMTYVLDFIENTISERPQQFAIDTTVMPAIIVLVVAASVLGTVFSARRIVKRKAVQILRMS